MHLLESVRIRRRCRTKNEQKKATIDAAEDRHHGE